MTSDHYDVVIVGGGAAGLAAAGELSAARCSVCVLEARNRLGGRILTRHEPGLPVPLELGAEFVHGRPTATLAWLARCNAALVDAPQTRWLRRGSVLRSGDRLFDELRAALTRIGRPRRDLPFGAFLRAKAARLSPRLREFAGMLVEGFDAADAAKVSTLSVLDEWLGEGAADAPTARPQHGYGVLIDALAAALDPEVVHVRLDAVAREVRWRAGTVRVDVAVNGRDVEVRARHCIVTLPLGVLQLPEQAPNAVRFAPALATKRDALAGLATGAVIKVLLRFRSPFWEAIDGGRYADAAFFHAPRAAFPTFWTPSPQRAPLLAAWAAGPAAARMAGSAESDIVQSACDSVDAIFAPHRDARANLVAAHLHDWQADEFACGAYSYLVAGHERARVELARPLESTLFFAGEAAATGGESGTVAGALASGTTAAQRVLAVRNRAKLSAAAAPKRASRPRRNYR